MKIVEEQVVHLTDQIVIQDPTVTKARVGIIMIFYNNHFTLYMNLFMYYAFGSKLREIQIQMGILISDKTRFRKMLFFNDINKFFIECLSNMYLIFNKKIMYEMYLFHRLEFIKKKIEGFQSSVLESITKFLHGEIWINFTSWW